MAGEPMRFRNPAGHAGLVNNLVALAGSLTEFFSARVTLFARESKSALVHFAVLIGCMVGALILCLFGYVFLIASMVAGIAHALGTSWVWVALGAAAVHFVLALICLLVARGRVATPVFSEIAAELKKDREWLKSQDKRSS